MFLCGYYCGCMHVIIEIKKIRRQGNKNWGLPYLKYFFFARIIFSVLRRSIFWVLMTSGNIAIKVNVWFIIFLVGIFVNFHRCVTVHFQTLLHSPSHPSLRFSYFSQLSHTHTHLIKLTESLISSNRKLLESTNYSNTCTRRQYFRQILHQNSIKHHRIRFR